MRTISSLLLFALPLLSQAGNTLNVTGDAEIKVVPDQVQISLGVESRAATLAAARQENDRGVKSVLAAIRKLGVAPNDIQTDFINVSLHYNDRRELAVDYYSVDKSIAVVLRDVSKFEELLSAVLDSGANHIYGIDFRTTELRKYRDQARAMAIKAATEKANDLAAAAGLKLAPKPLGVSAYNYGGGSWYGWRGRGGQMMNAVQNVYQQGGSGGGPEGTIALGKISVTASVAMSFQME